MSGWRPAWHGYLADPFVLKTGGGYFAYGTDGPSYETYRRTGRRFPVLFSHDLKAWDYAGGALTPPRGHEAEHFWAPEVAEHQDRYYLFYSAGGPAGEGHALRVAVSTRPEGPFQDLGRPLIPSAAFSIDASPFRDPATGAWHLFFARDYFNGPVGTGVAVARLRQDLGGIVGRPRPVLRASAEWQVYEEGRAWYGKRWRRWHTCEGPFVVFRHGAYYLFYSGGNWQRHGYGVGCARAERIEGPYRERVAEPTVLRSVEGLRGPGHCSVFQDRAGRDVLAFHAWDEAGATRQMHLALLEWNSVDDVPWPVAAGPYEP